MMNLILLYCQFLFDFFMYFVCGCATPLLFYIFSVSNNHVFLIRIKYYYYYYYYYMQQQWHHSEPGQILVRQDNNGIRYLKSHHCMPLLS